MRPLIPLAHLSRELTEATGRPAPSYRSLYSRVLDGHLPAVQENGRWYIRRADLLKAAAALGVLDTPPKRRQSKSQDLPSNAAVAA